MRVIILIIDIITISFMLTVTVLCIVAPKLWNIMYVIDVANRILWPVKPYDNHGIDNNIMFTVLDTTSV